jgi:hypothetical protein
MLDPEASSEDFEPLVRPGLMKGLSRIRLPGRSRQTTR